eukprot:377665-Prymnesium_polylepis.1
MPVAAPGVDHPSCFGGADVSQLENAPNSTVCRTRHNLPRRVVAQCVRGCKIGSDGPGVRIVSDAAFTGIAIGKAECRTGQKVVSYFVGLVVDLLQSLKHGVSDRRVCQWQQHADARLVQLRARRGEA